MSNISWNYYKFDLPLCKIRCHKKSQDNIPLIRVKYERSWQVLGFGKHARLEILRPGINVHCSLHILHNSLHNHQSLPLCSATSCNSLESVITGVTNIYICTYSYQYPYRFQNLPIRKGRRAANVALCGFAMCGPNLFLICRSGIG